MVEREKATDKADLPHRYVNNCDGICRVCGALPIDGRHLAWEKASLQPLTVPGLIDRELGT